MGSARPLSNGVHCKYNEGEWDSWKKNEHNRIEREREREKGRKLLNRKDDVDGPRWK